MQIEDLFKIQKEANSKVQVDPNLSDYKVLARKHLELQIKMSELASETKCYQYWVDDNFNINKEDVFKKYISCFKQVLSLGIDKKYDKIEYITIQPSEYCLSDQFLNLYIDINDLLISSSEDHFITLLEDFLSLSISLGFSEQDIIDCFNL